MDWVGFVLDLRSVYGSVSSLFPGLACGWFSFMDFVCLCNRLPYGIERDNFSFGKRQFLIQSFPDLEGFVSWCPSWDFIVLSVFGTLSFQHCAVIRLLYCVSWVKRGLLGRQMLRQP
jgi:hypothetical protein